MSAFGGTFETYRDVRLESVMREQSGRRLGPMLSRPRLTCAAAGTSFRGRFLGRLLARDRHQHFLLAARSLPRLLRSFRSLRGLCRLGAARAAAQRLHQIDTFSLRGRSFGVIGFLCDRVSFMKDRLP